MIYFLFGKQQNWPENTSHNSALCSKCKKGNGLHKSSVLQCTTVTKNIDLSALKKGSGKFLAGLDNLEIQILAIAGLTGQRFLIQLHMYCRKTAILKTLRGNLFNF